MIKMHILRVCQNLSNYGTAQRQLDSRGYITRVFLSCCTHPRLCVHTYMHAKG